MIGLSEVAVLAFVLSTLTFSNLMVPILSRGLLRAWAWGLAVITVVFVLCWAVVRLQRLRTPFAHRFD